MPNPLSALSIAVVLVTIAAVLFWPERGLIPRRQQAQRLTARVLSEDAVKHIYKSELKQRRPTIESLADVRPGENAIVQAILPTCRGSERRRFLDLGILPGTHIKAELGSPSGDPTAYRIRGALIALRREQARYIIITRPQETGTLAVST